MQYNRSYTPYLEVICIHNMRTSHAVVISSQLNMASGLRPIQFLQKKKIKLSPRLNKHHAMKKYCGGGIAPRILGLGTRLPDNHWIGGCVVPRAGLDAVRSRKILAPAGNRTPVRNSQSSSTNVDMKRGKGNVVPVLN
jgi:hypothetical protein